LPISNRRGVLHFASELRNRRDHPRHPAEDRDQQERRDQIPADARAVQDRQRAQPGIAKSISRLWGKMISTIVVESVQAARKHLRRLPRPPGNVRQQLVDSDDAHVAIKNALRMGAVGFDAIKHLVLCQVEKRPPKLDLDAYPHLPRANVGTTSAASYMSLMADGAS
jgi:hypothetical protein